MSIRKSALVYTELLGLVILSVLCYQGQLLVILFLVPLQLFYYRYGRVAGRTASFFFIFILVLWGYLEGGDGALRNARIMSDILFAGPLLVMLDISNIPVSLEKRLGYLLFIAGISSLLFIFYLQRTTVIQEGIMALVADIPGVEDSSSFLQQVLDIFFSLLMSVLLLVLFIGRLFAGAIHAWMKRVSWSLQNLILRFTVPKPLLWIFLFSWLLVLLSTWKVFSVSWLQLSAWNLALSLSLVYYLQGLHLIIVLLKFYRYTERVRRRILMLVILLGFIPLIGLITGFLVVLAGVGKLWISFPPMQEIEKSKEE